MIVICILQFDLMDVAVSRIFVVRKYEIKDTNSIDTLQMIVPLTFGCLFTDGDCSIVNATVLEVFLLGLLHLHNETAAVLSHAVDIEYGTAVAVTGKAVNITVPTDNASLANGAGYQTADQVNALIESKVSSTYKPQGSVAFASLPSPAKASLGHVYNVTDSFTTTSSFVEGAGKQYPAGSNVAVVEAGSGTYKWDVLAGFVDLSGYASTDDVETLTTAEIQAICS